MNYARHRAWWGYIQAILRKYRSTQREQNLTGIDLRETEAVRAAIAITIEAYADGELRVELIDSMYWKRTHTMEGAAQKLNVSYRTARRWHVEFIKQVAYEMGLEDNPPFSKKN